MGTIGRFRRCRPIPDAMLRRRRIEDEEATLRTWLTPPTQPVFIISLVLAILAVLAELGGIAIPVVSKYEFETLLLAYGILVAGNLVRNL